MITVEIDKLTHCLELTKTKEVVETKVKRITDVKQLKGLNTRTGWYANWSDLLTKEKLNIYALYAKDDNEIQGLIALRLEPKNYVVYIQWMVSNPKNRKKENSTTPKYTGVGGHLFAIAAQISLKNGFDGYFYGDAANSNLKKHYIEKLNLDDISTSIYPNRVSCKTKRAIELLKEYEYDME